MARHAKFNLKGFEKWLIECGAIVEPRTNPWELIRVRTSRGVLVSHVNKLGTQSWPTEFAEMRDAFMAGSKMRLSPELKGEERVRALADQLADRDGLECWFCSEAFADTADRNLTIEHLVAKSHGGPNHPSNLVLACKPCNEMVGRLPVATKVSYRETRRGMAATAAAENAA